MNTNAPSRSSRALVVLLAVLLGGIVLAAGYSLVLAAAWANALGVLVAVVAVAVAAGVAGWAWRLRAKR